MLINNKKIKFIIKEQIIPYIENILSAVSVISNYIDISKVNKDIFYNFSLPSGRGDRYTIKIKNKLINIIDESYNSNPLSLEFAINKFDKMRINRENKKILLGDMLELGKFSKKLHKEAANAINRSEINKVFVYGKHIKETFNKIKTQKKGIKLNTKNEILNLMKLKLKNNDCLMVKGSNATGLNTIFSKLKKGSF